MKHFSSIRIWLSFVFIASRGPMAHGQDGAPSRNVTGREQAAGAKVIINQIDTSAYPKVTIYTSVLKDGVPLRGLKAGDFRVREDEIDQEPLTVVPQLTPLSAVMALDCSGSMKKRMKEAQDAAKSFVDSLSQEDKLEVIGFARQVNVLAASGADRPASRAAIDKTVARGDTALYDAIYAAVESLKNKPGRKAVTLLSDGADDNGKGGQLSKHSLDDVLAAAREVNVPIFAIGVGTEIDEPVLKKLADNTGAVYAVTPDPSALKGLYARITEQLAGQYNIFYTSNLPGDGSERNVQLKFGDATGSKQYKAPVLAAARTPAPTPVPAPTPTPTPASKRVNLLDAAKGGQLIAAPNANWSLMIDGKEDTHAETGWNTEGIFAFKDEGPATFDTFSIFIPGADSVNIKEFELLAGDTVDGEFRSIGKFQARNMMMLPTKGWQDYKFDPVTAKYFKLKVISRVEGASWNPVNVYEIRLTGELKNP